MIPESIVKKVSLGPSLRLSYSESNAVRRCNPLFSVVESKGKVSKRWLTSRREQ